MINQNSVIDFIFIIMVKVSTTTLCMRESLGVLTVVPP